MKTKKLPTNSAKIINDIVSEHWKMTYRIDASLNYLWHMYNTNGLRHGEYKDFILFAELGLCKAFGVVTDEDINGIVRLLQSPDAENTYLAIQSVKFFRDKRIELHGTYPENTNEQWEDIRSNYVTKVLSMDLLASYFKSEV
jgi:hypothetical protein